MLYLILRTQGIQPFNPEGFDSGPWNLSFNTTSSFVTNTNWQYYGGETTLTYFAQMAGLAVQNFVSAAVGIAVLAAVIRGFAARSAKALGNFWVDLVRISFYILLPISFVAALVLVSQGVIQTLDGSQVIHTIAGGTQTMALGPGRLAGGDQGARHQRRRLLQRQQRLPVRELERVDQLRRAAADPGDSRRPHLHLRSNGRQPAPGLGPLHRDDADVHRRGQRRLHRRAARLARAAPRRESSHTPSTARPAATWRARSSASGSPIRSLWTAVTTVTSCGAVNAAFDSLTGIGGLVPTANLSTGEVIFGGVGSGLYYMLMLVLLTVFIAGLMVGRTPEFLGKKIESREVKLVLVGVLVTPLLVLIATALAVASPDGTQSIYNPGPQGFSESLYAYMSQANNNGSAFAGYTGFIQPNAPGNVGSEAFSFANLLGGLMMLFARFLPMIAALGVAGSLAAKRIAPAGAGTFRSDSPTFVVAADRRRRRRRRTHLLPRLPPRARRPTASPTQLF